MKSKILNLQDYKVKMAQEKHNRLLNELGIEVDEKSLFKKCREEKRKEHK